MVKMTPVSTEGKFLGVEGAKEMMEYIQGAKDEFKKFLHSSKI